MIGLPQLKARIGRLDDVEGGLTAELTAWKDAESPLLPGECEQYLEGIHEAIIGLYGDRDSLEDAVQRLEERRLLPE